MYEVLKFEGEGEGEGEQEVVPTADKSTFVRAALEAMMGGGPREFSFRSKVRLR